MVKAVMVRLDGGKGDELRLRATGDLADRFGAHVVGLFLNNLPEPLSMDDAGATLWPRLIEEARERGNETEKALDMKLGELGASYEFRRFDVFPDAVAETTAREARTADCLVALRLDPDDPDLESEQAVEGALFGSGRHVFLAAHDAPAKGHIDHAVVAWNGSREAARAVGEALPYLREARATTVMVIERDSPIESNAALGQDAVAYLKHEGVLAGLHRVQRRNGVSSTLMAEARSLDADLVVMGGYGHARMTEWLLGGATYTMMRRSPVSLVVAH